nr:hypothetical protein [Tanacetum cinerariifolium]
LHEVRQAYLSFEARKRALLAFDETKPFEEDETTVTPPPPRPRGARISVRPQTPMAASTQALIDAFATGSPLFPLPPTSPAYDQASLESSATAARAPRGQYDFANTIMVGQSLVRSPGHDAQTIDRAADIVEDVGYVRALHAFEHRMMTSIKEVNLRIATRHRIMPVTRQVTNVVMTPESIQAMIDQALQRNSTQNQDDASQNSGGGPKRPVQPICVCSYTDFMKCQPLNFKGMEGIVGLS